MRPISVTLNALGNGPWLPVDYAQNAFGIGLCVMPWSTASGITFSVQHTFDGIDFGNDSRQVSISRSGTTATVTDLGPRGLGHGLVTGDSLIIKGSGSTVLDTASYSPGTGDAGVDITVTGNTTYTYVVTNSGPTADGGFARALTNRVFNHSVIAAQTTRQDGNYAFNIRALRLKITAYTAGAVDLNVLQGTNT